jgi:hypothetical protein
LNSYTNPTGGYAFATYDRLGKPNLLEPVDFLAPVLLQVRLTSRDLIALFNQANPASNLRVAMEALLNNRAARAAHFININLATDPSWALVLSALSATKELQNWKAVAVTKVLHRKRPDLVPLFDSKVYGFYFRKAPSGWKAPNCFWPVLQADLQANQSWLAKLSSAYATPDKRPLSLLRAADIIIWHHQISGCSAAT